MSLYFSYQPVVLPVAPPDPIVTESHHQIKHDWECCYVYHRVLWILCLVLVLFVIAATFFCVISAHWIKGRPTSRAPDYGKTYKYFSTLVPDSASRRKRTSVYSDSYVQSSDYSDYYPRDDNGSPSGSASNMQ